MTVSFVDETLDQDGLVLVRRRYFDATGALLATTQRQPDGSEVTLDPNGNPVDPTTF